MPRSKEWTDQEILDALVVWARAHGRSPRWADWKYSAPDHPTSVTVWARCGSWNDALELAGLEIPPPWGFGERKFDHEKARRMRNKGLSDRVIAEKLRVHPSTIGKALGRKTPKPSVKPTRKPRNAAEAREWRIDALKKALANQ